jgi:hypothetical protein
MGQYFLIVNKTKKEYLYPHIFGDGLKLLEFGCSSHGTMTALALMLRQSNEGGGGDFCDADKFPVVGSWAGDRIVIIGDYDKSELFQKAEESYKDVSWDILDAMANTGDMGVAGPTRGFIEEQLKMCRPDEQLKYNVILRKQK